MTTNNEQLKQDIDQFLLDLGINNVFNKELFSSLKDAIAVAISKQTANEEFKTLVRDGLSQAKILINVHLTTKDDFWIEDIENGYLAAKLFEIDAMLEQL